MQQRMRTHTLTQAQVKALLTRAQVGRIATQSPNGYPYVLPVHYIYHDQKIYVHGLPEGQKIDYLRNDPKVGFEIDEMLGLLHDGVEMPCDVNTEYNSVVIMGDAAVLTDVTRKKDVLRRIVEKYTPHLAGAKLSEAMVAGTAVIEITVKGCTGKYYR